MAVDDVKARLRARALAAVRFAAVEARTQLREDTNKDTGRTSRAWYTTEPSYDGRAVACQVRHPQTAQTPPDVLWLDQGTRPHQIRPRKPGGYLRFPARDGTIIYTRRVNHPGYAGSQFIDPVRRRWPTIVQRAWQATG